MSDTQMLVGKLIDDEVTKRDAVHVAVMAVTADSDLQPGQRVCLSASGDYAKRSLNEKGVIGIVDPFLRDTVYKGDRFWLFLLPNTVTSLRHVWTHPKVPDEDQPESYAVDDDYTGCGC